jgi:type IV pilus assembly protein PilA
MKKTNKRGFTLIELMIVVAIIGILAAVAIPAFINYMKRAKTSEATLNLKNIAEGAVSYYDTRGSMLPDSTGITPAAPSATPMDMDADMDVLFSTADWQAIGWKPHKEFLYAYSFQNVCGTAAGDCAADSAAAAVANAWGDLDGDTTNSYFWRNIAVVGGTAQPKDVNFNSELE